ncbi:MAG: hypothetical protein ACRCU5_10290 [Rhizobiaceae bacterium]
MTRFLMETGFLTDTFAGRGLPREQMVIKMSDLTEEGQDFIMSGAHMSWLGALDRKSNDLLKRGASNEERLAVRADPKGLYTRLEKFRKERTKSAH